MIKQGPVLLSGSLQGTEDEEVECAEHSPLDVDELYLRHDSEEPHQPQLWVLPFLHDRRGHGAAGGPALYRGDQLAGTEVVVRPLPPPLRPHHVPLCFCWRSEIEIFDWRLTVLVGRFEDPPDHHVPPGKILCHLRNERWFPVHSWGDADLPERPGDRSGQRHVHGLPDGLAVHRLLSKYLVTWSWTVTTLLSNVCSTSSQRRLHSSSSQSSVSSEPSPASTCRRLLTWRCQTLWRTYRRSGGQISISIPPGDSHCPPTQARQILLDATLQRKEKIQESWKDKITKLLSSLPTC